MIAWSFGPPVKALLTVAGVLVPHIWIGIMAKALGNFLPKAKNAEYDDKPTIRH